LDIPGINTDPEMLKSMGVALGATIACLIVAAVWLWPEEERRVRV